MTVDETVLPEALLQRLALDIAPMPPDPPVAARLRHRVFSRIRADAATPRFVNIASDQGWEHFADGAQKKVLFDDGRTMSWLVRLSPGAALPAHEHLDGPEECLVLSGDVWLDGQQLFAGDYQLAHVGTTHATIRTDHGCVLFARSPSRYAAGGSIA